MKKNRRKTTRPKPRKLVVETDKRFWKLTNYKRGQRLNPTDPIDKRMMLIWMDIYHQVVHAHEHPGAKAVLAEAARTYALALKHQHDASAKLHRALSRGKDGAALDRAHGDACDALDEAEHALLVCAAVVGGWSRRSAERSV